MLEMRTGCAIFLLLLAGCAARTDYIVIVDAISSVEHEQNSTYVLLSANEDVDIDDLQFREFAQYIHRALAARGFLHTENINEAELAIFLYYGIGDPQEHYYTYSIPIWGQTGVSSSTTTATMNFYGNTGYYSGTTTHTPTYGITGYSSGAGSYVTYFRHMALSACDIAHYQETQQLKEVWRTYVASTGSSGDLRRVFPIMVAAAWQHIGENSRGQVQVKLNENSPLVREVKGMSGDLGKR